MNTTIRITQVDWAATSWLAAGGYAQIYQLDSQPAVVAKVGLVTLAERDRQERLANQGLALPVIDYGARVMCPKGLGYNPTHEDVCAAHGTPFRDDAGRWCGCQSAYDILLMPLATPVVDPQTYRNQLAPPFAWEDVAAFERRVQDMLGGTWDAGDWNIAVYEGRLVALDLAPHTKKEMR